MIDGELKRVILDVLRLSDWALTEATTAAEVPGWDSLSHVSVIVAVENRFGVRFKIREILRLGSVGDLQRLLNLKRGIEGQESLGPDREEASRKADGPSG